MKCIFFIFLPGPDICGYSTKKVHVIFNYKGKNHLIKKEIKCKVILVFRIFISDFKWTWCLNLKIPCFLG